MFERNDLWQRKLYRNYYWSRFFVHDITGHTLHFGPLIPLHWRTAWGIHTLTGSWELFQNSSPVTGVVSRRPHIVHGEENKQSSESKQSKTNLTKQNWWNGKRETTGGLNLVSRNNCVQCNICKWVENSNENAIALFAFIGVRVRASGKVRTCVCSP